MVVKKNYHLRRESNSQQCMHTNTCNYKVLKIQKLTKKVRSLSKLVSELRPDLCHGPGKNGNSKCKGPAIEIELPFSGGEKRSKDWAKELRKKVCLRSSKAR